MRITIELHDDLAEMYRKEADERTLPIESVIEGRLAAATRLDPRRRYVILDPPVIGEVEKRVGGGHLQDAGDLLAKITRLAQIKFGAHEIELTPGQMEEIAWRADKQVKSVDQMIHEAYRAFAEQFFTLLPTRR